MKTNDECKFNCKKILNVGLLIANAILLGFNTHFLCNEYPRYNNFDFDYLGVIVGILSLLVTVLIGLNIVDAVKLRKEWELFKSANEEKQRNLKSLIEQRIEELHNDVEKYAEESVKKSVIQTNMRLTSLMVSMFYLDKKYELMLSFVEFGLNQSTEANDEDFINNFLKYIKKVKDINASFSVSKNIKEELMKYVIASSFKDELLDYVSNLQIHN